MDIEEAEKIGADAIALSMISWYVRRKEQLARTRLGSLTKQEVEEFYEIKEIEKKLGIN